MAIRVADGVVESLRQEQMFALQVRQADDEPAALQAMEAAEVDITELEADWSEEPVPEMVPEDTGPHTVGPVLPATTGPTLFGEMDDLPQRTRMEILRLVMAHLERAGVGEALVALPERSPFVGWAVQGAPIPPAVALGEARRSVVLVALMPRVGGQHPRLPSSWLATTTR